MLRRINESTMPMSPTQLCSDIVGCIKSHGFDISSSERKNLKDYISMNSSQPFTIYITSKEFLLDKYKLVIELSSDPQSVWLIYAGEFTVNVFGMNPSKKEIDGANKIVAKIQDMVSDYMHRW